MVITYCCEEEKYDADANAAEDVEDEAGPPVHYLGDSLLGLTQKRGVPTPKGTHDQRRGDG